MSMVLSWAEYGLITKETEPLITKKNLIAKKTTP